MSLEDEIAPELGGPLQTNAKDIRSSGDLLLDVEGNLVIDLGDLAGANRFVVRDGGAQDLFSIDSNGNLVIKGSILNQDDVPITNDAWTKLELPIAEFAKTLLTNNSASTARSELIVDVAGTDNSPSATETVEGKAELATQAEVDAGTDTVRIVTPATLANKPNTTPSASETVAGIAELATQAEVSAGTDVSRIVTPATLAGLPAASETVAGRVELATQAEVDAGIDTNRVVTPATLAGLPAAEIPFSTETIAGKAELATQAEVDAGADISRIVTPATLANYTGLGGTTPSATETLEGIAELATQAEVDAGTDVSRIVTPATLTNFSGLGGTTPSATETVEGKAELATQAEVDAGTDVSRIVTPATLANYTGLGSGGGSTTAPFTRLITGGSIAINSLATTALPVNTLQSVMASENDDVEDITQLVYRLESGTLEQSSPWIVRPLDYAATTNEKYWRLVAPTDNFHMELFDPTYPWATGNYFMCNLPSYWKILEVTVDVKTSASGSGTQSEWNLQVGGTNLFSLNVDLLDNATLAARRTANATFNSTVREAVRGTDLEFTVGSLNGISYPSGLFVHIKSLCSPIPS